MAGLRGDLTVMSLADLTIWLANRGVSGSLVVERGTIRKHFTIDTGHVLRASSTARREALGQFLVNFGLITEEQLLRAIEVQQETDVLLGRILVMTGLVDEPNIVRAIDVHLRELLLDALRWDVGVFAFEEQPADLSKPQVSVRVPLFETHREAARRAPLWEQYLRELRDPKMGLIVHPERLPSMASGSMTQRVVQLARAGLSAEAIILETHAPDFQVYSVLHDLVVRGALELREPSGDIGEALDFEIDEAVDFVASANEAMERADYRAALGYAEAAAKSSPGDPAYGQMARDVEERLAGQMQAALPSLDAVPRLTRPMQDILRARRRSAKERYILTRVDGHRSIRAIVSVSPMREVDALAIFEGLRAEGAVAYSGGGGHAPLPPTRVG